jgi:hypothetical protein
MRKALDVSAYRDGVSLTPLTRYWYDREKGEVVAICESSRPPREGLSLIVTNIYGEIVQFEKPK